MDFSFKIEGLDGLDRAFGEIPRAVQVEVDKAVYVSAQQVASDYKKSILSGGKSGRTYKRRTVTHRASAPGEAPASDTGRLVNSVQVLLESAGVAVMRVSTAYAFLLEFGTSRIAPRPAAVPAVEKNRKFITDRLAEAVDRGTKAAGK